jgi:hypothetical protein
MSEPPNKTGLKLLSVDPTEDHPYYGRARIAKSAHGQQGWDSTMTRQLPRAEADKFVSGLKSIGIDFEELIRDMVISWLNCCETADRIQDNLSQLGSDEKQKRWWQAIATEWKYSGGIRLV